MLEKKRIRFIQILCLGILAACQTAPLSSESLDRNVPADVVVSGDNKDAHNDEIADTEAEPPLVSQALTKSKAYQEAINLASSAFTLGQQAQSPDDWDLIVGRWHQAVEKLNEIPTDDPNYSTAQTKLKEYEGNLAQAKQRLARSNQPTVEITLERPLSTAVPTVAPKPSTPDNNGQSIPIVERRGGTPVIEVMFNGKRYPMILDTGASHTHITRAMANELGIQVVGQASVATASSNRAVVDVGYMESIRVGNVTRTNIPVSIGDAVPIGLLGNDVYAGFDVILQVNSVEFRPQ